MAQWSEPRDARPREPGFPAPPTDPTFGQWGPPGYRPMPKTNGFAIASLVCGCIWMYGIGSILAVVFGHIALAQIRKSNGWQTGDGLAKAGLVLGYLGVTVFGLIFLAILSS